MHATSAGALGLHAILAAGLLLPADSFSQTVFMPDYMPSDPGRYCTRSYRYSGSMGGALLSALNGKEQIPYRSGAATAVWIEGVPGSSARRVAIVNDGRRLILPAAMDESGAGVVLLSRDCSGLEPAAGTVFESVSDGALIVQGPFFGNVGGRCSQLAEASQLLIEIQQVTIRGVLYDKAVIVWAMDAGKPYRAPDLKGKDKEIGLRLPSAARTGGAALTELIILGKNAGYVAGGDLDAATGALNFFFELSGVTCQDGALPVESQVWTATGPPEEYITDLAVHPRDPSILLASANGGLFRSTDAGENWRAATLGLGFGWVSAIAFAPSSPDTVFVGTHGRGLFRSMDAGRSWLQVAPDLNVNGITVHPQNADIVYVSGDSDPGHKRLFGDLGVFLSRNGGMSWTRISDANATVVSLIPSSLTTACVGTSLGEVFCKDEKDTRWTRVFQAKQTGQSLTVGAVLFDPRDSRVAYVQADSAGVYKTVDAGATWSQILVLARALIRDPATGDLYAGAGRGAIRSTDGGATWMSGDTALTTIEGGGFPVLALGGKYLYAGADYGGFILRSQDKGGSFEVVQRGAVDTRSVHAHLGGNGSVLAGDTGYGIFKAESWNGVWRWKSKNDLPTNGGPVYAFASHPASPDRIFAAAAYALLRSTDGGETWDRNGPSSAGMGHVVDIALDVSNPSRMYALTSGTGVWMTEDAGDSWARLTEDGVRLFSSVLAAEAGENARLYAGGARQGLWGSEAGGRVWRRLASGNPALTDVLAVAVGPGSAKTVWVGTSGYLDGLTYQRGSLYTSADYGENWKEFKLPGAIWKVTQIVFDPIDPAVIYIGGVTIDDTESSTVFRSGDAGATWTAYPTGVSDEIMRLAPDPSSPGRIFAATRAYGLLTIQTAPPTLP